MRGRGNGAGMLYRPLHEQTRWVEYGLLAVAVLTVVVMAHDVYGLWLVGEALDDKPGAADRLEESDELGTILADVAGIGTVVTGITWLVWHHQATRNLWILPGPREPRYSPAWAVWQWVIPCVSLVLPKRATDDLWRAGEERDDVPRVFDVWWAAWIAAWILNPLARDGGGSGDDLAAYRPAYLLDLVLGAVTLACAWCAVRVVRAVRDRQEERACAIGKVSEPARAEPRAAGAARPAGG